MDLNFHKNFNREKILSLTEVSTLMLIVAGAIAAVQNVEYFDQLAGNRQTTDSQQGNIVEAVTAAGCFLEPEIFVLAEEKKKTLEELSLATVALSKIESDIENLRAGFDKNTEAIAEAKKALVSPAEFEQVQSKIARVETEMSDSYELEKITRQIAAIENQILEEKKVVATTENRLKPIDTEVKRLAVQLNDRENIEDLGRKLADAKAAYITATEKIQLMQLIEDKSLEVFQAEMKVKEAEKDRETANGRAEYAAILGTYNTLVDQWKVLENNFNAKYGMFVSSQNKTRSAVLGDEAALIKTQLAVALKSYTDASTKYSFIYDKDVQTASDLRLRLIAAKENQAIIKTTHENAVADIALAQNKLAQNLALQKQRELRFGQTYYPEGNVHLTEEQLVLQKNFLQSILQKLTKDQKKAEAAVAELEQKSADYEKLLAELTAKKAHFKIREMGLGQDVLGLTQKIESARANICWTSEALCSDGVDNDRDGVQDCRDQDCSQDAVCYNGTHAI